MLKSELDLQGAVGGGGGEREGGERGELIPTWLGGGVGYAILIRYNCSALVCHADKENLICLLPINIISRTQSCNNYSLFLCVPGF